MKLAAQLAAIGAAAATLYQFEAYGVIAALPDISRDLGLTPSTAAWIPAAYLVAATGGLVSAGAMAGRASYRILFMIALACLALGALLGAAAPGPALLISGRAMQGLGGGMLAATAYSMIGTMAPETERRAILGWLAAGSGLGMILGAPIGGWVAEVLSWRMLFVALAVLTVLAQIVFTRVPQAPGTSRAPGPGGAGIVAFGLGTASLGTGATLADVVGLNAPITLAAMGFGIAALIFFGWQERSGPRPMFPRQVWANCALWRAWLSLFAGITALAGTTFLLPFYLQQRLGLSAAQAGMFLLALTGAYAVASLVQAKVVPRIAPGLQTFPGFILAGAGTGCLAAVSVGAPVVALACAAVGFGIGLALPAVNDGVVASLDEADRPRGSTLIPIGINLGSVTGVIACGIAVHVPQNGPAMLGKGTHLFEPAFWLPTAALMSASVAVAWGVARR